MKKIVLNLLLLPGLLFLISCAAHNTARMVPESAVTNLSPLLASDAYVEKLDGLVVLMDASSSMDKRVQNYRKFDVAKAFLTRMNETMPSIDALSGLRTFGHASDLSEKKTRLFYGMENYSRPGMNRGLNEITKPGGTTPMSAAIAGAAEDLEGIEGRKAVIIVSDGEQPNADPLTAAQELKKKFGQQLCIYTVLVGDDDKGKALMEGLAGVFDCGNMTVALNTLDDEQMTAYVTDLFLTSNQRTMAKTEPEQEKATAETKKDVGLVYSKPDPLVPNLSTVYFEFDSAELTDTARAVLDLHVKNLKKYPDLKVLIQGYTSKIGTNRYNLKLSQQRATSVKKYFINKGLSPEQFSVKGYGEQYPAIIEENPKEIRSPAAKANMRVEFKIENE